MCSGLAAGQPSDRAESAKLLVNRNTNTLVPSKNQYVFYVINEHVEFSRGSSHFEAPTPQMTLETLLGAQVCQNASQMTPQMNSR